MNPCNVKNRTIFCSDNLEILRGIESESIDLIYLDPPFNTGRKFSAYNINTKESEGVVFSNKFEDIPEDLWYEYEERITAYNPEIHLYDYLYTTQSPYLLYMTIRLIELYRILKPTGSIYLHCDSTSSHYLKIIMDYIFDKKKFRSEIIWQRHRGHHISKTLSCVSDSILFYTKSHTFTYNQQYTILDDEEMYKKKGAQIEKETGRWFFVGGWLEDKTYGSGPGYRVIGDRKVYSNVGWKWTQESLNKRLQENPYLIYWSQNDIPSYKIYFDEYEGMRLTNIWEDIHFNSLSMERAGYPTQKPVELLDRIIKLSSNDNDIVLDPFCGSGTTLVAAEKLGRQWIGIDISDNAIETAISRVKQEVDMEALFKDEVQINKETAIPGESKKA